jgi:DNA gyrase subunit B
MPIEYNSAELRVVSSAEVIRMQPEMYIGSLPNPRVLNRLVEEFLCLTVDEAACGRCTEFAVAVASSGSVTIRDNGPGLPMEPDRHGSVLAEVLLTTVAACRAAKQSQAAKGACCHLGLVVANALSEWLWIRVFRDGGCWFQEYQKGAPQAPFRREADANETGVELSFCPDSSILGQLEFDAMALAMWLPSTGLRFESLDYREGNAQSGEPLVLHFTGMSPCTG